MIRCDWCGNDYPRSADCTWRTGDRHICGNCVGDVLEILQTTIARQQAEATERLQELLATETEVERLRAELDRRDCLNCYAVRNYKAIYEQASESKAEVEYLRAEANQRDQEIKPLLSRIEKLSADSVEALGAIRLDRDQWRHLAESVQRQLVDLQAQMIDGSKEWQQAQGRKEHGA